MDDTEKQLLDQLGITELQVKDNTLQLRAKHPAMAIIAQELVGFFDDSGGINYVELQLYHTQRGLFNVTVQRVEGKTPHTLRSESDAKVVLCVETLKHCHKLLTTMSKTDNYTWNDPFHHVERTLDLMEQMLTATGDASDEVTE